MKTYKKKTRDILEVTDTIDELHITEETRAEIQTKIDHLKIDKGKVSEEIDALEALISLLDEGE